MGVQSVPLTTKQAAKLVKEWTNFLIKFQAIMYILICLQTLVRLSLIILKVLKIKHFSHYFVGTSSIINPENSRKKSYCCFR